MDLRRVMLQGQVICDYHPDKNRSNISVRAVHAVQPRGSNLYLL